MTFERLWAKEHAVLLRELRAHFGGEIIEPKSDRRLDPSLQRGYSVEPSYFVYPAFQCEISGVPLRVEISEMALDGQVSLPDERTVEYLVLRTRSHTPGNFRIRPEGIFDRVRKALKLHWEHETGDKEFDHLFNIDLPDHRASPALARPDVRALIIQLLPFEYLQAHPGGLRHSTMIEDPQQLSRDYVFQRLERLVELATILQDDHSDA